MKISEQQIHIFMAYLTSVANSPEHTYIGSDTKERMQKFIDLIINQQSSELKEIKE